MSLKTRLEKAERQTGVDGCPACSVPARIQIYNMNRGEIPPPNEPRECPKCGRDRGISRIVVMIPDNGRDKMEAAQ
jgi:hypothetical protein